MLINKTLFALYFPFFIALIIQLIEGWKLSTDLMNKLINVMREISQRAVVKAGKTSACCDKSKYGFLIGIGR